VLFFFLFPPEDLGAKSESTRVGRIKKIIGYFLKADNKDFQFLADFIDGFRKIKE